MAQPRHRHRGASYVASASDGIIKTSHKVYASSSDDDSPAGFLQSAYNSPPASPRCAPRRQVTYSVTESEEDVSESPDAFVVELTRSENFWTQRVRWYPYFVKLLPNFRANGRGKRPSVFDAMANPADAAADAIDAVRAVADVSVQAIRRRRTDAVVEMNVLTNYCVAAFRDEPRVLPINSSS